MKALAETEKITELLEKLAGLDARDKDVIDNANLKDTGFEPATGINISLSLEEETPGDAKVKKARTVADYSSVVSVSRLESRFSINRL